MTPRTIAIECTTRALRNRVGNLVLATLHARCADVRHLTFAALLATALTCGATGITPQVRVADHGAIVNDGACDAVAIRAAIQAASLLQNPVLVFEAGVYNLGEESAVDLNGELAMMHIHHQNGVTLRGAVTPEGAPATELQMNLALGNDITGASHMDIRYGKNVTVENLIVDHAPRFATAGEIVALDLATKTVEIEIFPNMPHFDGMKAYSANNWNLATRLLIEGPPLTIGTSPDFPTWEKMAGHDNRYRMVNSSFYNLVQTGQGISFHFNVVAGDARALDAYELEDIVFRNIKIHSAIGMAMGAGDNRNMTFEKFHIKPQGNSLAVGPRDGIHISRSTGKLKVDDLFVKGVRWDPFVSYLRMVPVEERQGNRRIRITSSFANLMRRVSGVLEVGSKMNFWSGVAPHKAVIGSITVEADNLWWLEFTADLPAAVIAGSYCSPEGWWWDNALIQNSVFEGNFGTALVFQSANLLVENCTFRNNSYSNIGIGPTSSGAGSFSENITIRNNVFEGSSWVEKYTAAGGHRGTITLFNNFPGFTNAAYNRNILIAGNVFRDINASSRFAVIHVKNASGVTVRNNWYQDVANTVIVESGSTNAIVNERIGRYRTSDTTNLIDAIPEYLRGLPLITIPRGPNAPVPGYTFQTGRDVTVYLAVHQRGDPVIPEQWELMPEDIVWFTSGGTQHKDWIYRRRFSDGQVEIPPHPGVSDTFYAVPHMVFILQNEGVPGNMVITGLSAEPDTLIAPAPGFYEVWADAVPFDGDSNSDGITNGTAFLLGASGPNVNATALLPNATTNAGGGLKLNFGMRNSVFRHGKILNLQHSTNLGITSPWRSVLVPETSGAPSPRVTFTVIPGDSLNAVEATISPDEGADRIFSRIQAVSP